MNKEYVYRLMINGVDVGEPYNSVEAAGLKLCRLLRQAVKKDTSVLFSVEKVEKT